MHASSIVRVQRARCALVVVWLLGCSRAGAPAAPPVQAPEPPRAAESASFEPAAASAPSDAQLWRVSYVLQSSARLNASWPTLKVPDPCVIIVAPEVQWGLNCDGPPTSAFRATDATYRARAIYVDRGELVTYDGRQVSRDQFVQSWPATVSVRTFLEEKRQPQLWASTLELLVSKHPAFPPGTPSEEWLAIVLHEQFHAMQLGHGTFDEDLKATQREQSGPAWPTALYELYEQDARFRALLQKEHALLSAECAQTVPDAKRSLRALRAWSALYAQRRSYLRKRPNGAQWLRADTVYTYIEGTARYVENAFLLDPTHRGEAPSAVDPRFESFAGFASAAYAAPYLARISPHYVYSIGMHLGIVLDRVDPTWKQHVAEHPDLLVGLALDAPRARARPVTASR